MVLPTISPDETHQPQEVHTTLIKEEKLLKALKAGINDDTIALYERLSTESDPVRLPRIAAIRKLQIIHLARLTFDSVNTAEFLVKENDHRQAELEVFKQITANHQETHTTG